MKISPRAEWVFWFAVLAVVTVLMVSIRRHLNDVHVALAYLLVVQGASARGGRPLGFILAGVAFICFDLLFLPPYNTFRLQDPLNWIVLVAFLITSLVSAELLYRARRAAALQEANRAKDAVLASVSHDLRTPLTAIKGLAHEIAETGDERAEAIEEQADQLGALVAKLLDLSRVTSGAAAPDVQPNEIEDLLGVVVQRTAGSLGAHELRIELDPAEPLLFGRFDFAQTARALVNLVENAAKYSSDGHPIDIIVRRDGKWLRVAVADRGAGVSVIERERIFEPFYRASSDGPRGAGLGLSIARGIAEAQGGALVYATREGGGSVFTLTIPAIDLVNSVE